VLGPPITDSTAAELARRLSRTHGWRAGAHAARLWAQLQRPPLLLGRRRVERLHDSARELFDLLAARGQG
jgi:hypothetical protein